MKIILITVAWFTLIQGAFWLCVWIVSRQQVRRERYIDQVIAEILKDAEE